MNGKIVFKSFDSPPSLLPVSPYLDNELPENCRRLPGISRKMVEIRYELIGFSDKPLDMKAFIQKMEQDLQALKEITIKDIEHSIKTTKL